MKKKDDLDRIISFLANGSPAPITFKNILQESSSSLLTALEEIFGKQPTKQRKKIPEEIVSSSTTVLKTIFQHTRSEGSKRAISLLFSLSKDKDSLEGNLKTILSNEHISESLKEETLRNWIKNLSPSVSLFFLLDVYQKNTYADVKDIIRDTIYLQLKDKRHSFKNIRLALALLWKDIHIDKKLEIISIRGLDHLPGFKKLLKNDISVSLKERHYYYNSLFYNNPNLADIVFSFGDNNLSRLLLLYTYKQENYDSLSSYIKSHDSKETFSRLLDLLVKHQNELPFNFWKRILLSFTQFDIYQLLPYVDHPNKDIQERILELIKGLKHIDWSDSSVRNSIRKRLKHPDEDIRDITIEILEKYEHQKTLLPVLSVINRGNREEIEALDLSILDQSKNSHHIPFDRKLFVETTNNFPFKLTKDQYSASKEIIQDMGSQERMYRLLQGDVASGKTEVVLLSMAQVIKEKKQCVLLCPTHILAHQQFERCKKFFNGTASIKLLTSNTHSKDKEQILNETKEGNIDILIGTHSILQDTIDFKNLALSIIDEQQKFGVIQRSKILKQNCHALEISATPIPRSLSLRDHGLIDVTNIRQLPKGRKPPKTSVIHSGERKILLEEIKERIDSGEQVYRVCKSISSPNYKSVHDVHQELQKHFPNKKIQVIHGKKQASANQSILQEFISGKIDILVSTTMIESGLDIPNAKSIVIENAESYGLSQLHQMRGRVARDTRQGFCFLCTDVLKKETIRKENRLYRTVNYYTLDIDKNEKIETSREKNKLLEKQQEKIETLLDCFDGYKIAEKDLELNGGGEIRGIKQRGNF